MVKLPRNKSNLKDDNNIAIATIEKPNKKKTYTVMIDKIPLNKLKYASYLNTFIPLRNAKLKLDKDPNNI